MIQEAYCSYEVCKLLKKKGFDECIFEFYVGDSIMYARNDEGFRLSELPDIYYPHITHQMAMKWLREEKKIYIRIIEDAFGENYHFEIYSKNPNIKMNYYVPNYYESTYEEAVEAALKYILKNLI